MTPFRSHLPQASFALRGSEHPAVFLTAYQLVTTLTKNHRPASGRLSRAYVGLALMPERDDHSKAATLERYGAYEVRLVEFQQVGQTGDCLFWLELYCHATKSSLDSCRCENLDDAETDADDLISRAEQLHKESE